MKKKLSNPTTTGSIWQKINIDLPLLILLVLTCLFSLVIIWSATGQSVKMLDSKIMQIIVGFITLFILAQFPPRFYEKCAPYLYLGCIFLLVVVFLVGHSSKGAQRWLNLGFIRFQPSEIAKLAVPLMVARLVNRDGCPPTFKNIFIILVLVAIPTLLIVMQPDLGTAILVAASGLFVLFLAGLSWRLIVLALLGMLIFVPVYWHFFMHIYQKQRILTFLNPGRDPLGAGYHIIQSEIAIGSGGIFGKGWLQGTQAQLAFLPEKQTDFIFSVLAEEFGLAGVALLILLYVLIIIRGFYIATRAQNTFGRVLAGGIVMLFFTYVFVNIGMVSGLLPVVGVPLPLISYGGTALTILMAGFGIVMSINGHRNWLSKNL